MVVRRTATIKKQPKEDKPEEVVEPVEENVDQELVPDNPPEEVTPEVEETIKEEKVEEAKPEVEEKVKPLFNFNEPEKFRWKVNNEAGFHGTLAGKPHIYKPGEIFIATEEEVPIAFRDIIIKVDILSIQAQEKPIPGFVGAWELKESETVKGDWFVVNGKGKSINEKPLSKEKAELMLKDMMA